VEGRLTSGGASARKGGDEGTLRAKRRSIGGMVFTEGGALFYRVEARRERPGAFNGRCSRSFNAPGLKAPVTGD
jgi:hypothetical protein